MLIQLRMNINIQMAFRHICPSTESSLVNDELERYKEMIRKQEKELETLRSEFDLLSSDLELRKELTSELEVHVQNLEQKVHAAEEEAHSASCQLKIALDSKKNLSHEVG